MVAPQVLGTNFLGFNSIVLSVVGDDVPVDSDKPVVISSISMIYLQVKMIGPI